MMSTMFKKRLIPAIIFMACVMPLVLHAVEYDNEYLSYRATYKWGFIQKVAGDASLTLRHDPPVGRSNIFRTRHTDRKNAEWRHGSGAV